MSSKKRVNDLCKEVSKKMGLLPDSLFLYEYAASDSLCINEQEYPLVTGKKTVYNKSQVILNMKSTEDDEVELIIRNDQYEAVALPAEAVIREVKDDAAKHILLEGKSEAFCCYIKEHMEEAVKQYKSGNKFGCCSLYEACSLQKKCLHENLLYATGCAYRGNMEQGKIFYR